MANIRLSRTVLKKDQFDKSIDTSFKSFVDTVEVDNDTIEEFFRLYNKLYYDIAPEGVIVLDFTNESSMQEEPWYQGDTFYVDLAFINISPVAFSESLDVSWSLKNFETGGLVSGFESIGTLEPYDTAFFHLVLVEPSFYGRTDLFVTFNPETQLEQNYFNNSFYKVYSIDQDNIPPIVEAFFDDKIPNGIMESSASPKIDFYVIDDNKSAVKQDSSGIEIYISGPCDDSFDCDFSRINFSDSILTYDFSSSSFHVNIDFVDLATGYYELQFFGSDGLGNKNTDPFILKFYVNIESSLSYFLPYPSPFSSEMRFAYKKTGGDVPDNISIQIISSTGHSVREVSQEELGELKSGDNLTSWVWDGTDDNGNVLANGIYFYKVIVVGDNIKHLESSIDESFKKGWGSIMIAR